MIQLVHQLFGTHVPIKTNNVHNGLQYVFDFPHWTVLVNCHDDSIGGEAGLFELQVYRKSTDQLEKISPNPYDPNRVGSLHFQQIVDYLDRVHAKEESHL